MIKNRIEEIDNLKIFLHIGIQRTGTTFLQQKIFPIIEEINTVNLGFKELNSLIKNTEHYNDDQILKKSYSRFKQDKINLITNENIWWHPWTKGDEKFDKLEKIKQLFPKAKIIFGTREKTDMLLSLYTRDVMDGSIRSFQKFQEEIVNINDLNYQPYIDHLIDVFDKKNVYIYKFEDMKKDIHSHVKKICDFIGVNVPDFTNKRVNAGYSLWQLKVSLVLNSFFKTWLNSKGIIPILYPLLPHRIIFLSSHFPKKFRGRKVSIGDLTRIINEIH